MSHQLEFEYDVFISYSSHDKEWVRGELLKGIEKVGLRVFIDFRDFKGGAPSIKEMERGVSTCRKTLLVLTPDYIESEWCEIENIMLHALDPANRDLRLIPLLKTQCRKPLRIGALTHVDFTEGADFALAWHQLLIALGAQAERPDRKAVPTEIQAKLNRAASYVAKRIRKYKSGFAIALLILLLSAVGLVYWFPRNLAPIESIAVLPLVNASNDPNMEYLSDGITENIINSLSQLHELRVIPRTTVFRYKGQNIDPQKIGDELGVRAVLTGKVIQRGDTLVIQADLVDIIESSQLWGGKYNRKFSEIFQAQDEIAKEIVEKLRLKLSGQQEKLLTKHYTENTEAYKLYLQGKYYSSRWTEEGWKKSLDYFNRAIDIDPNYALAYAGLANSYVTIGLFGAMPPKEVYPKAKVAASKALQLDDSLAESHAALGFVKELYDWDFAGAKSAIKRAIEINPNNADAHRLYGYHFIHMGQIDEAIAEMRRAVELDPLSVEHLASLADAYIYARQLDQAIEQCKKALEMDQNYSEAHFFLARALEQKGMYQEAITEFQKAIEMSGGSPETLYGLGHAYAVSGKRDKARKVIDDMKGQSTRRYIDPALIASLYAGLGEKDEAFHWLEKAYEERSGWMVHAKVEADFDILRSDPRFTDLLRRIGLTP